MPYDKDRKNDKQKNQDPRTSNDQLGENAGEGRWMKEKDQKGKKKT